MSEVGRLIDRARKAVRVRERTQPVGRVRYRCSMCSMSIWVTVARGVVLPSKRGADDVRAPAPQAISCGYCGDDMFIDESSYEAPDEIALETPYLRVPSRSATAGIAASRRFEAQLVIAADE